MKRIDWMRTNHPEMVKKARGEFGKMIEYVKGCPSDYPDLPDHDENDCDWDCKKDCLGKEMAV